MKKIIFGLALILVASLSVNAQQVKVGLNVGDKAPEINLPTPEGKLVPLSSFKGKVVLIDFWASWCRPCRMENPNVVAAYNKYKGAAFKNAKGFEVYSVSLDRSKDAWLQAIQADNLAWDAHVSDLKFWGSIAAKDYQVSGIPYNYLIDENGIIIAKGLRGINLHKSLDSMVSSF